jgi:hypothetical protein
VQMLEDKGHKVNLNESNDFNGFNDLNDLDNEHLRRRAGKGQFWIYHIIFFIDHFSMRLDHSINSCYESGLVD